MIVAEICKMGEVEEKQSRGEKVRCGETCKISENRDTSTYWALHT